MNNYVFFIVFILQRKIGVVVTQTRSPTKPKIKQAKYNQRH